MADVDNVDEVEVEELKIPGWAQALMDTAAAQEAPIVPQPTASEAAYEASYDVAAAVPPLPEFLTEALKMPNISLADLDKAELPYVHIPDVITDEAIEDPLSWIAANCYQFQGCAVLPYDRTRPEFFTPQPYLPHLWQKAKDSGRSRLGSLPNLFCGMADLTCDTVCAYLHNQGLLSLGEWRANPAPIDPEDPLPEDFEAAIQPYFHTLGFCFPAVTTYSFNKTSNSMFVGYTFFQEAWRTPQQSVLGFLGLAYLFQEFRLANVHGVRYAGNRLTAKYASKLGFVDIGTIPNYLLDNATGSLTAATISTLPREVFVNRLRGVLQGLR